MVVLRHYAVNREVQHVALRHVVTGQDVRHATLVQNEHTVRDRQEFRQLGRGHDDRGAGRRHLPDQLIQLFFGANVDTRGRDVVHPKPRGELRTKFLPELLTYDI